LIPIIKAALLVKNSRPLINDRWNFGDYLPQPMASGTLSQTEINSAATPKGRRK